MLVLDTATVPAQPRAAAAERAAHACDLLAAALAAGALGFYLLTVATIESFGSDTSTYFELARSLRIEHRYWFNFQPHTFYPPGFPLLLAGFMSVAGETFATLVRLCVLSYFLGVAGLYLLLKREHGARMAVTVVALVVTSYVFYFWCTVGVHSEAAYFTVAIYALLCVDIAESTGKRWLRVLACCGVALLSSYLLLVRTVGVTWVAGLALWVAAPFWWRFARSAESPSVRLKRWAAPFALSVLTLALWAFWVGAQAPDRAAGDYMESYPAQILKADPHQIDSPNITVATLGSRSLSMLARRIENGTRTMLNLPWLPLGWKNPLCLLLCAVVAIGFISSLVRGPRAVEWYVLAYAGLLVLHPFDEGTRYLHPIHPFLIVYAAGGLTRIFRWLEERLPFHVEPRALAAAVVAPVLAMGVYQVAGLARANLSPDVSRFTNAATIEAAAWVAGNTPADAVIMNDQCAILHRLTGRRTLRFPLTTDPRELRARLVSEAVDYVVVMNERPYEYFNPSAERRFNDLRVRFPHSFSRVHIFTGGVVYKVEGLSGIDGTS